MVHMCCMCIVKILHVNLRCVIKCVCITWEHRKNLLLLYMQQSLVITSGLLLRHYQYHTVKKHWRWKNLGELGKLQHFVKFFANFYNFYNILYANGLQFAKFFSVELPIVLIQQTFLPLKVSYCTVCIITQICIQASRMYELTIFCTTVPILLANCWFPIVRVYSY